MAKCPPVPFSPFSFPPLSSLLIYFSSPFPPLCEQCGDLNRAVVIASAVQCGGLISEAPWLFLEVQLQCDWCFIKPFLQLWHFRENKQGLNFPSAGSTHQHLPCPLTAIFTSLTYLCVFVRSSPLNSSFPSVHPSIFHPLVFFPHISPHSYRHPSVLRFHTCFI